MLLSQNFNKVCKRNISIGIIIIFLIILVGTINLNALPYRKDSHSGVSVRFIPTVTINMAVIHLGNVIFLL